MALKLKQLLNMTARELKQLSRSDLRESYQTIRKITNSRVNTFKKHGIGEAVPEDVRGGLASARGRSDQELIEDMRDSLRWMRGRVSKYAGWKEAREDRREKMQDALPDLDLSDDDKFDAFGKFMGEMQDRYGEMWHAVSNQVRDIYKEAVRLNMNPKALMRNYDYWADHISDLENADPINTKSGRTLKPSEYARKLGLEKIGGGKRK